MKIKILTEKEVYTIARRAAAEEFEIQTKTLKTELDFLRAKLMEAYQLNPKEKLPDEYKLSQIEMSVRLANAFNNYGIATIGDVRKITERDFLRMRGMGLHSLRELKNVFGRYGIEFAP